MIDVLSTLDGLLDAKLVKKKSIQLKGEPRKMLKKYEQLDSMVKEIDKKLDALDKDKNEIMFKELIIQCESIEKKMEKLWNKMKNVMLARTAKLIDHVDPGCAPVYVEISTVLQKLNIVVD